MDTTAINSNDLHQTLSDLTQQLLERSKVYSADYILNILERYATALPDFTLFLLSPKFLTAQDDIRPDYEFLILPYLSYQIQNGRLYRFSTPTAAYNEYDRLSTDAIPQIVTDRFVTAFANVPASAPTTARNLITISCEIMRLYFHFNEYPKIMERTAVRFVRELGANDISTRKLNENLALVSERYGINIAYLYESNGGLRQMFGEPNSLFDSNQFKQEFSYSFSRDQVSDRFLQHLENPHFYTLIPNTRKIIDHTLPPGCVVLINNREPLNEESIVFTQKILQHHMANSNLTNQNAIIEDLHSIRRTFMEEVRIGLVGDRTSRSRYMREHLSRICEVLSLSLNAHSTTIRVRDCFTDELSIFASYDCSETAQTANTPTRIFSNQFQHTLTAAVFRVRNPLEPVRVDDLDNFVIPNDLKANGFLGPLRSRNDSNSEICCAIWSRELPLGTINIEAPRKRAFVDTELFVSTIARNLGDLFSLANEALSLPTVMQFGLINDAAHGAAEPEIETALKTLSPRTMRKLPEILREGFAQYLEFLRIYRRDVSTIIGSINTTEALTREITQRYEALNPQLLPDLPTSGRFTVEVVPGRISPQIAASVLRVVDIVFRNSAKYSKIADDAISIKIDALFPTAQRLKFTLQYKSAFPVEDDILESFGLIPIRKQGTVRYGAFLLGYQVRSLGGMLDVRRGSGCTGARDLEFRLTVPLGLARTDDDTESPSC